MLTMVYPNATLNSDVPYLVQRAPTEPYFYGGDKFIFTRLGKEADKIYDGLSMSNAIVD